MAEGGFMQRLHAASEPRRTRVQTTSRLPADWKKPIPYLRLVPDAPSPTCPKCSHPTQHGPACAHCGLSATHHETFLAAQLVTVPAELLEAWRDVRRAWDDVPRHDRVLRLAGQHAAYAWLATRYREAARRDDAIARERLALVQRTAELTFVVATMHGDDDTVRPYQATRRLLFMLLGVLALGAVLVKILAGAH
jgi:hypothetical protein